ncbi:MAG: pilus assembly protein [Acidobacteriota bacterium]
MAKPTISDSGVLVALLDQREQYHLWATEQADRLIPPFITCEAVITETCFLLGNTHKGRDAVLSMIEDGILQIDFSISNEISKIKSLMNKYADVPMSLADACLVRMSELTDNSSVFTLDSDFHIYRKNGRQKIALIFPE